MFEKAKDFSTCRF